MRIAGMALSAMSAAVIFLVTSVAAADWSAVMRLADNDLAAVAGRIEVVRVNGQVSHLEYYHAQTDRHGPQQQLPNWPLPIVEPRPYGSLTSVENGRFFKSKGAGGLLLKLDRQSGDLNLLPYHSITIHGVWRGAWQLAVADERLAQQQDNYLLGALTRDVGSQTFSLQQLPASFDRARGRYLVFRLESAAGSLELKGVTLQRETVAGQQVGRGAWLWDMRQVIGHEQAVVEKLQRYAITRLYLQVDDHLQRYLPFLQRARAAGVAVYALDGAPDAHLQSEVLLRRIAAVAAFNRAYPQFAFSGFQLDVEPYLQKDFSVDQPRHVTAYLALLDEARRRAGVHLPVSAAIPFWFDHVATAGRDLAQEVLRRVDELVVMAYRRDYGEAVKISTSILAAAEWAGKPVWLGVELTALPDEDHLELLPALVGEQSDVELAGRRWRAARSYQVKGAELSFAGAQELLPALLKQRPEFGSFQGWVLHSLEVLEPAP